MSGRDVAKLSPVRGYPPGGAEEGQESLSSEPGSVWMEAAEPKRREVPPLLLLHFSFVASLNTRPGLACPPTRVLQLEPNRHAEN